MTSDDVVASLKRWMQQGQYGRALAAVTADVKATGKYAIELKLKQKYAAVEVNLAAPNNFGAIYPKEIAEKFPPAEKVTEFVGTGPFKLAEWKPDQHIRMVRFDDYKSRTEKTSGYGGAKTVWVDEIRWIPVPDVATRVAQMETGELDFADDLIIDAFDRLQKSANARPVVAKPYYWLVAVLNKKEGLMTNQKLRQAWQAAIDIEPIMKAVAGGRSEFYRMDAGLAFVENAPWYVKPQSSWGWNERNKEKAKKLMQEAGYKGEPVRFVTTQEYKWMYDFALVTQAAARGRRLQHRPPGGGLGDARQAPQQPEGVRGLHHRDRQHLRADGVHRALLHLAGLDLRRGHPGAAAGDGRRRPIRRSASRSGSRCTGSGTRRCRRSATATSTGSGQRRRSSRASTRRPSARDSTTCGWSAERRLGGPRPGRGWIGPLDEVAAGV